MHLLAKSLKKFCLKLVSYMKAHVSSSEIQSSRQVIYLKCAT